MRIFKQTILALSLMGVLFNSAWAANAVFDFTVTPVTENVYSIISPSYGRPSPENKGWNSNSHFIVTEKGVLVFDTGSSELIGHEIIKAIKSSKLHVRVSPETYLVDWLKRFFPVSLHKFIAIYRSRKSKKNNGL